MKPEATMQLALFNAFSHTSTVLVPNIHYPYYEMDLLRITKAGIMHEYEIKSSKADFRNEFREKRGRCKRNKHRLMEHTFQKINPARYGFKGPNHFWFVCPPDIIKPDDLEGKPYGLIYVTGKGAVKTVTKIVGAPKLHDDKVKEDIYQKLARNLCIKLFHNSKKYN